MAINVTTLKTRENKASAKQFIDQMDDTFQARTP